MCRIAWYTIDNYPYCRNIHNQINGGDFALSSSPWLITFYTSCKRGQNRGCDIPLPLGITSSSVFHYIYTIHIQLHIKISKFCRFVPRSIIHCEHSGPSPLASMDFSCWFLAFSWSRSLGNLWLFPSSCSLIGKSWRKWCPPHLQYLTGCFIFTCSISFESSCLDRFLSGRLDNCPNANLLMYM